MIAGLVVGCGAIGSDYDRLATADAPPRSHAGAYAASSRTSLVGGVDPDPDARARFTARWGVPCHASLDEAFAAAAADVVSICTPPDVRSPIVGDVLGRGVRAIWIEKPLADSVGSAEAIVAACADSGVPLQLNFLRRFDHLHQRVAELVRGRALRADFRYSGTLENYGSHAIDLYRWFVGEPVEVVGSRDLLQVVTNDERAGTFARIPGSLTPLFDCDIWLEDARIALTALGEQLLVARPATSPLRADLSRLEFAAPDDEVGLTHAMSSALDALLDHLERHAPLLCTGADGVAELRVRAGVSA